jgi:hypothetical protein
MLASTGTGFTSRRLFDEMAHRAEARGLLNAGVVTVRAFSPATLSSFTANKKRAWSGYR